MLFTGIRWYTFNMLLVDATYVLQGKCLRLYISLVNPVRVRMYLYYYARAVWERVRPIAWYRFYRLVEYGEGWCPINTVVIYVRSCLHLLQMQTPAHS
jgi:hypothetical protein